MKWEMVKLGDICDLSQGIQVDIKDQSLTKKGNQVRFLRIIDFTQGGDAPRYIDNPGERYFLKENDLALVRYGSTGFVCRGLEGVIANNLFKVTPKQNTITNDFLYWILISDNFQNFVKLNNKGAALQAISFGQIKAFQIPLPPLSVQKEIAEILDTADALRKKDNELLKKYDELAQSIFIEMFGDPVRNEKGWEVKKLGDCIEFLTSGSRGWAKYYSDKGEIFLRINNVGYNELKIKNLAYVNAPENAEAKRTEVKSGDILLSITADIGRTCVIPDNFSKAFINQHLTLIRLTKDFVPYYVSQLLSTNYGQNQIHKLNKGGVKAGLNFDDIKSIGLLKPPFELQVKYNMIANQLRNQIDKINVAITHTNNLFHSLLQKAFKGELT
ncbi:MAG: restriction endonuclease subunit S [Leptospiraceae bacterium]|nr:restriction endonuclease subunit S [Leptospiraceae bacterium]